MESGLAGVIIIVIVLGTWWAIVTQKEINKGGRK